MESDVTFGAWLQRRRKGLDLTRERLAAIAHCSPSTIKRIESGDLKPSLELARLLAGALEIEPAHHDAFIRFARSGDETAYAGATGAPAGAPPQAAGNLPRALTSFVGRERELAEARALLAQPDTHLVTLTGSPGVGKTRLALALARAAAADYPDGVWFVALDDLTDPSQVPGAIARALDARPQAGQSEMNAVASALRQRRLLLVIDNFEHVLRAAPRVTRMLSEAEGVKALVTSRELLNVYGEQAYPVQPLDSGVTGRAELPASVSLFADRARAVRPGFQVTAENTALVAGICARLDGIPLAIEMAAAQMRRMTLEQVHHRLSEHLNAFASGPQDAPERQRSLRGTLNWSYDLLAGDERRVFAAMGVFSGGAMADDVGALCADPTAGIYTAPPDVQACLIALADKNLLTLHETAAGDRFSMYALMREFAREKLRDMGALDAAIAGHARHFSDLATRLRAAADAGGPELTEYKAILAREHDNLYAAFDWAIVNDPPTALRLANAAGSYLYLSGAWADNRRWLITALERVPPEHDPHARAHALAKASFISERLNDLESAARYVAQALDLARATGHRRALADALRYAANLAARQQHFSQAVELAAQAAEHSAAMGLMLDAALAYLIMGEACLAQNKFEEAERHFAAGYAIRVARSDRRGQAQTLSLQGASAYRQQDYARARTLLQQALAILRDIGDVVNQTTALEVLGTIQRNLGQPTEAEACFLESMAIARRLGDHDAYCAALDSKAALSYLIGNMDQAGREFTECLGLCQQNGDFRRACFCLEGLAMLALADGQRERAATLFGAAEAGRARLQAPLPPSESDVYTRAVADLAASWPDADARERAWRSGAEMSISAAIALGLDGRYSSSA